VGDVASLRENELENTVIDIVERHEFHGLNCMETMSQFSLSEKNFNFKDFRNKILEKS
jgi:hypothetical protein